MNDERDWPADTFRIKRHFWNVEPASLTLCQFIEHLTQIDKGLFGPVVHVAKIPK